MGGGTKGKATFDTGFKISGGVKGSVAFFYQSGLKDKAIHVARYSIKALEKMLSSHEQRLCLSVIHHISYPDFDLSESDS